MDQEGGSLNVNAGPHNPFTVQEKPIQQPAYKQQQFSTPYPSNPKFNSKPSEMYKQKSPHMKKMDPTATVNVYSQPAPKPMGLSTTVSPYLPFGMSHYDPAGFPKFYNPYGPELKSQYYNVGGEHAIPIGFIKNYNIFADNIRDYQTRMLPIIYQDSIPMRGAKHDLTTLSERILLWEYVKNNLVSYEEGEEGCMNSNRGINLMRQLKYLSPHPVNYNVLYTNPLQGLRNGLRIYRSCYPITVDRRNQTICQKDSIGIHIRFYKSSHFDETMRVQDDNKINDMKRELEFYRWVRNNILLKKVCPNFIMLYTYNNCFTCDEPFNTLDKSKIVRPMAAPFTLNMKPTGVLKSFPKTDSKCLVVITEAPNMNLLEWMTNERSYAFNKKTQNNYGYHTEEVWYSIYFQIWAALYTLEKNQIYINNFGYDNIWIKVIPEVGYWEYVINGLTYYVPNCGFLVMIDCSFQEKATNVEKPSIISPILFGKTQYTNKSNISELIKDMWSNIINDDPFGRGYVNASVRLPPTNIISMIHKCASSKISSSDKFEKFMCKFLHNRIGQPLLHTEMSSFDIGSTVYLDLLNYRRGELVVYMDDVNSHTYVWGLYLGNNELYLGENRNKEVISESDIRKSNLSTVTQSNINTEFIIDLGVAPLARYNLE